MNIKRNNMKLIIGLLSLVLSGIFCFMAMGLWAVENYNLGLKFLGVSMLLYIPSLVQFYKKK